MKIVKKYCCIIYGKETVKILLIPPYTVTIVNFYD